MTPKLELITTKIRKGFYLAQAKELIKVCDLLLDNKVYIDSEWINSVYFLYSKSVKIFYFFQKYQFASVLYKEFLVNLDHLQRTETASGENVEYNIYDLKLWLETLVNKNE